MVRTTPGPELPVNEIVYFTSVPFAPVHVIRSLEMVSRTFASISIKVPKLTSLVLALHCTAPAYAGSVLARRARKNISGSAHVRGNFILLRRKLAVQCAVTARRMAAFLLPLRILHRPAWPARARDTISAAEILRHC